MTTTPEDPAAEPQPGEAALDKASGSPGAEIGISEGEGSSFEPEEDPEGHG
jgi:hypothetical protein